MDNKKTGKLRRAPARTPEARENQMIALAMDLAEKQLREGTASSQLVHYFCKLGSTKDRIEKGILQEQQELIKAKTASIKASRDAKLMYEQAMNAFRGYSGITNEDEEDYDDY